MISEIQKVISIVAAVLGAVGGLSGINLSVVTPIFGKIVSLLSLLTGMQSPTTVDGAIADLAVTLTALKTTNIIPDAAPLDEALTIIAKFQAVEADYKAGQVALIDSNFSFDGIAGDLIAIAKGGAAAATLGM